MDTIVLFIDNLISLFRRKISLKVPFNITLLCNTYEIDFEDILLFKVESIKKFILDGDQKDDQITYSTKSSL